MRTLPMLLTVRREGGRERGREGERGGEREGGREGGREAFKSQPWSVWRSQGGDRIRRECILVGKRGFCVFLLYKRKKIALTLSI
jgi:hypothetical protein